MHLHLKRTSKAENGSKKTERLGGRLWEKGLLHKTKHACCSTFFSLPSTTLSFAQSARGVVLFSSLACLLFSVAQSIRLTSWNMFGGHPSFHFADEIGQTRTSQHVPPIRSYQVHPASQTVVKRTVVMCWRFGSMHDNLSHNLPFSEEVINS